MAKHMALRYAQLWWQAPPGIFFGDDENAGVELTLRQSIMAIV
jgi:hypothetical protein